MQWVSHSSNRLIWNLISSLGYDWSSRKKMVRFLFSPNDFKAPLLLANMDVYYYDCMLCGTLKGTVVHNCTRGFDWLVFPCRGCWKVLGKQWIECYVVAANGSPLEKWRGITYQARDSWS